MNLGRLDLSPDSSIEDARTLRAEARVLREHFRLALRRWRDAAQRSRAEASAREEVERASSPMRRLEKG